MIFIERTLNGYKVLYEYKENKVVKCWCSLTLVEDLKKDNGYHVVGKFSESDAYDEDIRYMERTADVMKGTFNNAIKNGLRCEQALMEVTKMLVDEIEL